MSDKPMTPTTPTASNAAPDPKPTEAPKPTEQSAAPIAAEAPKPPTFADLLANADRGTRESLEVGRRLYEDRRKNTIEYLLQVGGDSYTAEELNAMDFQALEKLATFARKANPADDPPNFGALGMPVVHAAPEHEGPPKPKAAFVVGSRPELLGRKPQPSPEEAA